MCVCVCLYKNDCALLLDDGESVGYWTTLLDTEVSHKTLLAIIYCLLERTKQVGKKFLPIVSECWLWGTYIV